MTVSADTLDTLWIRPCSSLRNKECLFTQAIDIHSVENFHEVGDTILTEDDVPGASLCGRNPEQLKERRTSLLVAMSR